MCVEISAYSDTNYSFFILVTVTVLIYFEMQKTEQCMETRQYSRILREMTGSPNTKDDVQVVSLKRLTSNSWNVISYVKLFVKYHKSKKRDAVFFHL